MIDFFYGDINVKNEFDLCIIGGGINGCAIAHDAQSRGLSVLLCEKDDLASHTSSNSSKLIHGGLRYLEHYQFSLVRKALKEREILLNVCPHLVKPLAFMLPYSEKQRPYWLLRLGLFVYDNMYQGQMQHSYATNRRQQQSLFEPLNPIINRGVMYFDAKTNDARLVISNALAAKAKGAIILTRTAVTDAHAGRQGWTLTLNHQTTVRAKAVVNASGWHLPKVNDLLGLNPPYSLSFAKGSHLVVKKTYPGDHAYILQQTDKRVIFTIPHTHDTLIIGTTDIPWQDDGQKIGISAKEKKYLLNTYNHYFQQSLNEKDIIHCYSGVRSLVDTAEENLSKETRDYKLYRSDNTNAPAIAVFGGKITTYRQLAEECLDSLKSCFPHLGSCLTAQTKLPGSEEPLTNEFIQHVEKEYDFVEKTLIDRYLSLYGSRIHMILNGINSKAAMGKRYLNDLYECEIDYLATHEWATSIEDILTRRTQLNLTINGQQTTQLEKDFFN